METSPTPNKRPEEVGPMAAIVIIVALLIAGGIYFLLLEQKDRNTNELGEEQASL